jgi:hypothetical protein
MGNWQTIWVTFFVSESVRKCEGMDPNTSKWAPTLRVGIPMESQIFGWQFQGSKFIRLKSSLYH